MNHTAFKTELGNSTPSTHPVGKICQCIVHVKIMAKRKQSLGSSISLNFSILKFCLTIHCFLCAKRGHSSRCF